MLLRFTSRLRACIGVHALTTAAGLSLAVPGRALNILCYGDSLTAGFTEGGAQFEPYAPHLQAALRACSPPVEAKVRHAGLSGWTAANLAQRADAEHLSDGMGPPAAGLRFLLVRAAAQLKRPIELAVIMAGTNGATYPGPACPRWVDSGAFLVHMLIRACPPVRPQIWAQVIHQVTSRKALFCCIRSRTPRACAH